MTTTIQGALWALERLQGFIPQGQAPAIAELFHGQDGAHYRDKINALYERISSMPETYGQDGLGDDAIAYLHYFTGSYDCYVTEKDMETEQHQAFGMASMGYGFELGYVSLVELTAVPGMEIDLYFEPQKIGNLKKES